MITRVNELTARDTREDSSITAFRGLSSLNFPLGWSFPSRNDNTVIAFTFDTPVTQVSADRFENR